MPKSFDPIFSPKAISAIAAMAQFRVVNLPTGEFCVFADAYPIEGYPCETYRIEDYPSEKEAKALCKRLIEQQIIVARNGRRSQRLGLAGLATPVY